MKIKSIRIRNFRSIHDATVDFGDYTCLVGPNGSGKSNVLHALNLFFREQSIPGFDTSYLGHEDFHSKITDQPIEITVAFTDLPDEAKVDLAHYVRQDQLIVSTEARFDPLIGRAEVKQFGRRLAIREFAPFFEADKEGKKVGDLKVIFNALRAKYPKLKEGGSKEGMITALRSYEEANLNECEEILSSDEFYGITKGKNLLDKYIQWVFLPAVKDATTEHAEARNTALGKLLARTVRLKVNFKEAIQAIRTETQDKYANVLQGSQGALDDVSRTLASRLIEWAHGDARLRLEWRQDPDKSVRIDEPFAQAVLGEGGFEGELTRFGHGLQRSFLLALLQELSGSSAKGGPTLILGCEEPELYQHPPQARHLYNVLLTLAAAGSQILIATHSPYFVSGEGFENVRLVRKVKGASRVSHTSHAAVSKVIAGAKGEPPLTALGQLAKIHQALQPTLSEMFFASKIVFAEGMEDIAYITAYLHLLEIWDDFRRLGCHMIPTHGKSEMLQPLAVAQCLGIPVYAILDSDGDKEDKNGSKEKHRKDNVAILSLCGIEKPEAFPSGILWGESVAMWPSDLTKLVASDIGENEWASFRADADKQYGQPGNMTKNALHIATCLQLAWEKGKRSPSLTKACERIIAFARVV